MNVRMTMSTTLVLVVLASAATSGQQSAGPVTLVNREGSVQLIPSTRVRAFTVGEPNAQVRIRRAVQRDRQKSADPTMPAGLFASTAGSSVFVARSDAAPRLTQAMALASPEFPVYSLGGLDVVVTQEVIVQFLPSVPAEQQAAIAASFGASLRPILRTPGHILTLPAGRSAIDVSNALSARPDVRFAEPNFIAVFPARPNVKPLPAAATAAAAPASPVTTTATVTTFPSDQLFSQQWALRNASQKDRDIRIEAAWKVSANSSAVTIAILDDGVDSHHPDLKDKIVNPFDAITGTNGQTPNPWDSHGTASAGIAAATTNNGVGIAGVGLGAKIMPVRIAATDALPNPDGSRTWATSMEIIGRGIYHAADSGADVLSNSWNGGEGVLNSFFVRDAIEHAVTKGRNGKGAVVVFSVGNGGSVVEWPATLAKSLEIIAVAATNEWDELKTMNSQDQETWWGSNFGDEVSVAAPGVHLVTTDIAGAGGFTADDYVSNFNGTSGAAPHVAGVAALVLAQHPDWTPKQVRDKIVSTADMSVVLPDKSFAKFGRINACKALDVGGCD
jgi:thermitase